MQCEYILELEKLKNTTIRRYSELILLPSYYERLKYLECHSVPYEQTFGPNRYFNQDFYRSVEWKRVRDQVILRDNGCDLGIPELPIRGKIMVHHLNPIAIEDILDRRECLMDLENLICCSLDTHSSIHYGIHSRSYEFNERSPNDMTPWRK